MSDHLRSTSRRRCLQSLAIGAGAMLLPACTRPLFNPCLEPQWPLQDWELALWSGIDAHNFWDVHVHLAGIGEGGSGIVINRSMSSPFLHPIQYVQRKFYINASCVNTVGGPVDLAYVTQLKKLMRTMPAGCKALLLAFDRTYREDGTADDDATAFYLPSAWAKKAAQEDPDHFEWITSVHPYRDDAVSALEEAAASGARAIKWLPPAMGIDPASPRCDAFYRAASRLNLPILTHGGEEKAVHGANRQDYGNPLRLRRALQAGATVIVAHCATLGKSDDLDQPRMPARANYELFSRLMGEKAWEGRLFGDISAIYLRNHPTEYIQDLLLRDAWHARLLYGSDYPLPGILPLAAPKRLAKAGLLAESVVAPLEELQQHHPLRFSFALMRLLRWQNRRFSPQVFATRAVLTRAPHQS